jgi:hypothetical protein
MTSRLTIRLVAALACIVVQCGQGTARAGEVIAHPSVKLGASDIRDVYLGEKQFESSLRLIPVDNAAAQEEFLSAILQTNQRQYQARWVRKTFREGLPAPPVKDNDAAVRSFVRSTPGAVGYVSGSGGAGVVVLDRY